jgi:hypothetical protein
MLIIYHFFLDTNTCFQILDSRKGAPEAQFHSHLSIQLIFAFQATPQVLISFRTEIDATFT